MENLPSVRGRMANKPVEKTLTIPKWLNDLAERERVAFSSWTGRDRQCWSGE